jgi:hypothetical protein
MAFRGPVDLSRRCRRQQVVKVIGAIPVAAPLPDVARHVVEAVAILGKRFYGRDARKAILAGILDRELSLVG